MAHKSKQTLLPALILTEIIIGTGVALLAFYLFADLSRDVLSQEALAMDHILSRDIYALRTPLLTNIMFGLTFLGGNIMLLLGSISVFLILFLKNFKREAILFLITFGMGVLLNLAIKFIIGRARPDMAPLIDEIFYSYPSGHSMNAFVFYALLAYFIFHFSKNIMLGTMLGILFILLIFGIGFSRVYLGVHYPSDVFAGFFAGAAWFLTVMVIDRTFQAYHYYRQKKVR